MRPCDSGAAYIIPIVVIVKNQLDPLAVNVVVDLRHERGLIVVVDFFRKLDRNGAVTVFNLSGDGLCQIQLSVCAGNINGDGLRRWRGNRRPCLEIHSVVTNAVLVAKHDTC